MHKEEVRKFKMMMTTIIVIMIITIIIIFLISQSELFRVQAFTQFYLFSSMQNTLRLIYLKMFHLSFSGKVKFSLYTTLSILVCLLLSSLSFVFRLNSYLPVYICICIPLCYLKTPSSSSLDQTKGVYV